MKIFNYWVMPENLVKGQNDKWIPQPEIEAKNRKEAANQVREKLGLPLWTERRNIRSKDGQWKLRLVG